MNKRILQETENMNMQEFSAFLGGFELAVKLLKENEHYGHYSANLAKWLGDHTKTEVTGETANG